MGMVVRTNTMSTNAYRQLGMNNTSVSKSLEKLSSGFRINRAGDDASGLAISEKMKAQIKGLEQASSNSQDGISLIQTAEGALTETHSMLNRMVSLATKSANGTIQNQVDRDAIQTEVDALNTEISRIAKSTNFNGINLLDGNLSSVAEVTATAGADIIAGTGGSPAVAAVYTSTTQTQVATPGTTHLIISGHDYTSVAGDTDLEKTLTSFAASYNTTGTDRANWTASVNGTKDAILFTATAPGTLGTNGTTAPSGTTVATAGADIVPAVGASAAKAATTVIDYTGKTGEDAIGTSIAIDGKTYEFVKTGDTVKGTGNIAVALSGATATGTDIATALNSAMTTPPTGYTTAAAAGKLTITSSGTGASAKALAAKQIGGGLVLQVGDTNADFNKVEISVADLTSEGLGLDKLDVSTQSAAAGSIATIKSAINQVSTNRGTLGALQNRLEYTINNLDATNENMEAANSRIRDTDMAKEMMQYTKMNILTQAAQAMLAQANQNPQSILQLLQ